MNLISVKNKLKEVTNFLAAYRSLIDSHMVNFFTEHLWEKNVPSNIREEIDIIRPSLNQLLLEFWGVNGDTPNLGPSCFESAQDRPVPVHMRKFVSDAKSCYLSSFDSCLNFNELQDLMKQWGCVDCNIVLDQSFMSLKKSHEVEVMSSVVASMCKALNCSHVIDIGGGKGYLSSVLFLQHKLKVLGLDSSSSNTHVATKRTEKMRKAWNGIRKRIESGSSARRKGKHWKAKLLSTTTDRILENESDRNIENDNLKSTFSENNLNLCGGLCDDGLDKNFKQATRFVSSETKLHDIFNEYFPDDYSSDVALTGLHTCGNLASSCLKLFTQDATGRLKFLVNVGCCYHLLTEKYPGMPSVKQLKMIRCLEDGNCPNSEDVNCDGFPMSSYLCDERYTLSYNSRVLSSQSVERISEENKLPSDALFYRALFEVLLWRYKYVSAQETCLYCVGRINSCSFSEYVFKAIKKLGLNLEVSEEEINQLYCDYEKYKTNLYIYFMMRVRLAPVIEAIILLDRLLYLLEAPGIEDAYLVKLFNPVLSPRCYGIISLRKTADNDSIVNNLANTITTDITL